MKNLNDEENVLVETLKQTAKIMNSLAQKVNRQEEEIENIKNELIELKNSKTFLTQPVKSEESNEWSEYIEDMVEDKDSIVIESESVEQNDNKANTKKYGKNSKIMEFIVNKSDKNKLAGESNETNKTSNEKDKNRIRRNVVNNDDVNESKPKESKVKQMVEHLIKEKKSCDDEIQKNKDKIQVEMEGEEEEEEENKKETVTKIRRRGARF